MLDILAEWKALYEKHNIPDGWSTWMIEVGEQNDMMVISEAAKDGASFYAAMDENGAKIKEEEQKLWQKLSQYVTGMEQKFGQPRPDLGFMNMDMEE